MLTRVRTQRIPLSTQTDRASESGNNAHCTLKLPDLIRGVLSIQVAAYDFPTDLLPTFYEADAQTNRSGNNVLEFQLYDANAGGGNTFIVQMPQRLFSYEELMDTLESAMNDAVLTQNNGNWAGVEIDVVKDPRRRFIVKTNYSTVEIRLMFGSGARAKDSMASVLGFPPGFDTGSQPNPSTGKQLLRSPLPVKTRTFDYLDLIIKQADQVPAMRVFVDDPRYTAVSESEPFRALQFQVNNTTRTLDRVDVTLKSPDGRRLDEVLSALPDFGITLKVLHLDKAQESIPVYASQQSFYW